jgi:transcriptional regulator with XRE-family HTH domain
VDDSESLGQRLRAFREATRRSQQVIAGLAGISQNHYGNIERGETEVSFLVLCRIVDALGVTLNDCRLDDILPVVNRLITERPKVVRRRRRR